MPEQPWEEIAAAKGWAPEDCLNHKLALKKREKEAAMKETFMTHIRCLRSLGRHLLSQNDRCSCTQQARAASAAFTVGQLRRCHMTQYPHLIVTVCYAHARQESDVL